MSRPSNLHGTAVILADRGVLIRGRSGAGKSSLALALCEALRLRGRFARLVGDDQVYLATIGGRVVVEAPDPVRGLVEIHGIGPSPVPSERRAVIDLVVDLVDAAAAPRFQDGDQQEFGGAAVPAIRVPERAIRAATSMICARLRL